MDKKVLTVISIIIVIGIILIGVKIYSNITTETSNNDIGNANSVQEEKVERKELTEEENTELMKAIEQIGPADYLSKSFKPEELTEQEKLKLAFYITNPKNSGFTSFEESVLNTYTKCYFGFEELAKENIMCDCKEGKILSNYDEKKETFDSGSNHYLDHISEAYNEYIESYLEGDKYVVSVYKIFPDLTENASTRNKNFYATYEDAKNEENILFSSKTDNEFTKKLEELDDSKKVKYIYTFVAETNSNSLIPNYRLISYEIAEDSQTVTTNEETYEGISNIEITVELDHEYEFRYSEPLSIEKNDDVIKLLDTVIGAINSGEEYKTDAVGGFFEGSAILTIYQEDGTKLQLAAIDGFEPEGEKKANIIGVWTKDDASDKILYEVDMEVNKYLNDLYEEYNK